MIMKKKMTGSVHAALSHEDHPRKVKTPAFNSQLLLE